MLDDAVGGIFGGLDPIPVRAVPLLLAGLWAGLAQENDLVEFEACQDGAYFILPQLDFILKRLGMGGTNNEAQALLQGLIIYLEWPVVNGYCGNMEEDWAAFGEWAAIFTDFTALRNKVIKALTFHHKAFIADLDAFETDYAEGQYYAAGFALSDLLTLIIGPITPVYPSMNGLGAGPMAVNDFVAGMVYGFTGSNHRTEIEACYRRNDELIANAEDFASDLMEQNWTRAVKDYNRLSRSLECALESCRTGGVQDDLKTIEAWASIFSEPVALSQTVLKNWDLNSRAIAKDIASQEEEWRAGNYFEAGVDTADAFTKLVGLLQ